MRLRRALALALPAALLFAAPASAKVDVGLDGSVLRITADGLNDSIRFSLDTDTAPVQYVVSSTQSIARVGTHCTPPTFAGGRFSSRCPESEPTSIAVVLGGGNDSWIDERTPQQPVNDPLTLSGGLGDDSVSGQLKRTETLNGDEGDDSLRGGGGSDTLNGGAGDDRLDDGDELDAASQDTLSGGPDNDNLTIHGGGDIARGEAGFDEIIEMEAPLPNRLPLLDQVSGGTENDVYSLLRDRAVSIRDEGVLSRMFTDGLEEQILSSIERFNGGRGADVINGAADTGTPGPTYDGRWGPDTLVGSDRTDVLFGGDGADRMFGRGGNDIFDAKEGEPVAVPDEVIECGDGSDQALIDLLDPEPVACEQVARSAIGEGPHVRIGALRRAGRRGLRARLRCPRALRHPCRGTLAAAATRRALGRSRGRRYAIRAGRARTVGVRLARRSRRVVVRSVEKGDVTGVKTTTVRRALRRR